jgi:phenylalanyl-tRNA synthetase beta chain
MRVPVAWLKEYCDPGLDTAGLAHALNMSGTEVERIASVGVPRRDGNGGLFRIAQVTDVAQHPDADRLKVCRVRLTGSDERTIVCGAPNVAAGQAVMVALPGAVLADGTRLDKAKLRGVESEGMILSETEVQLGTDSEGIMVLPDSVEPGEEAQTFLPLSDDVLELEVTPNRPDCLSVYGVARELHAATGAPLAPDPGDEDVGRAAAGGERGDAGRGEAADLISVTVDDFELCPRFSVRVFTDVRVGPSPLWLKARLMAAGQRPISNVVDITNYVMLLLGQPMHAYDLNRVGGPALHVRSAREGERLATLDGEQRVFDGDAVLVCDANGPAGIGGIMGGAASEVTSDTTRVAMEAATWNGTNILRTSKKLALRTEASGRFEKQLHPRLALQAQRLAARLMVELCGARMVPGTIDVAAPEPQPHRVVLRANRVEQLLGERIEPEDSQEILERLGFHVERRERDLEVEVPYFRHQDVYREADLIEEVARVHGLERLPTTLPAREHAVGGLSRKQKLRRRIEDHMWGRGLSETVTFSFTSPDTVERLRVRGDPRARPLAIANPLSEDQSVMRVSLLPGLLEAARHNVARDMADLSLFETGRVFYSKGQDELPTERLHLGVVLSGAFMPGGWRREPVMSDFYVVKGLLAGLLDALGVRWRLIDGGPPFLHPGKAAEIVVDARDAGCMGELHPAVSADFGLEDLGRPPAVLELDLDVVLPAAERVERRYVDLISYPAVFQDIAVIVDEAVEAHTVMDCVRAAGGPDLREVRVFDLYRGEQVGAGRKSLALRLEFRSPQRTLTDEEVAAIRERIKEEIARETGGTLRE